MGVVGEGNWQHDAFLISQHMISSRVYLIFALCSAVLRLQAADPNPQPSMYERITKFYAWNDPKAPKASYQGKTFDTGASYSGKTFKTDEYAGVKEFGSKPFLSRTFDGAKKSWMGQLLFHEKKLPENLSGENRDALKTFASKDIPLKNFGDLDKKSGFSTKEDFATREIKPKAASQGAIDADQQLQAKIKKGLSIDDVRKLLNKGP